MVTKHQTILLYACVLLMSFLTLAVVLANLGAFGLDAQKSEFSQWGIMGVGAEAVGLFVYLVKYYFSTKTKGIDVYVSLNSSLDSIDFSKLKWDTENCLIVFVDTENDNEKIKQKISLTHDHGGWKISYSKNTLKSLYTYETAEIHLKDLNGIDFFVHPFKPLTQSLKIDYNGNKAQLAPLVNTRVEQ